MRSLSGCGSPNFLPLGVQLELAICEQISLLKSRGLTISDDEQAKYILSCINYYRFSGYLFGFRDKSTGMYPQDLTFAQVKRIYDFDRRLTKTLLFALEDIEETLKTRLSYTVTSCYPEDSLVYLNASIYRNHNSFVEFQSLFFSAVKKNKGLPFVKHHIEKYGGNLPMWVAVELFTMGNLHAVYNNLISPLQKKIAKQYGTGPNQLKNWIRNLTYTRNHLAHNMRIYDYDFARSPMQCKNHPFPCEKTNRIFDQVFIMCVMYSDHEEWTNYIVPELSALFEEYSDVIQLQNIGFPENWKDILKY